MFESLFNESRRLAVSAADILTGTEQVYGWFGLPPIMSGEVNYSTSETGRITLHHLIQGSNTTTLSFKNLMTKGGRNLENNMRTTRANKRDFCLVAAKTLGIRISKDLWSWRIGLRSTVGDGFNNTYKLLKITRLVSSVCRSSPVWLLALKIGNQQPKLVATSPNWFGPVFWSNNQKQSKMVKNCVFTYKLIDFGGKLLV